MAYNEDSDDFLEQIEINVENSLTSVVKCINQITQTHHVSLQLLSLRIKALPNLQEIRNKLENVLCDILTEFNKDCQKIHQHTICENQLDKEHLKVEPSKIKKEESIASCGESDIHKDKLEVNIKIEEPDNISDRESFKQESDNDDDHLWMDDALYTSEKYDLKHENMSKSRKKSVKKSLFDENNDPPDTGTDIVENIKCEHCQKTFDSMTKLKNHVYRSHKQKECKHCKQVFLCYNTLKRHIKSEHLEMEGEFTCSDCGEVFQHRHKFDKHRKDNHQPTSVCDLCGKTFLTRTIKQHVQHFHYNIRNSMCTICNKSFYDNGGLQKHMRCHTGEKPYSCDECDRSFSHNHQLKRHKIIHTDVKPYSCEVCGKGFNQESNMKVHFRSHTKLK